MEPTSAAPQASPAAPRRLALAGGFVLDLAAHALRDAEGRAVELRPQAFEVLRVLAARRGELVTKDELLAQVWPGLVVTDDSLVQAVRDVRRALGPIGPTLVRNVPRRGYLMEAAAEVAPEGAPPTPPPQGNVTETKPRRLAAVVLLGMAVLVAAGAVVWRVAGWGEPPTASPPSIAVLPFTAPTPDGAALARDLAAHLASELARSTELRVVASQSSFALADERQPVAEIGRRLRSRYLVAGTVRRDGERLRMAIDLVDTEDGRMAWSSVHEVDRDSLAATQRALVERIAGSLQVRMARHEERRALEAAPRSLDVVALTAQGRAALRRYSAESIREARRHFEQAIERDANYAPAWVSLAQVNIVDIGLRLTGEWDRARLPEVSAQLQRAIALQPDHPAAYHALADAQGLGGEYDASVASATQCLRLSPNDAGCLSAMGAAQLRIGQVDEAVRHLVLARDRNPVGPAYLAAFHGSALWAARRLDEALHVADECLALAADFHRCRVDRIASLVELGRLAEAQDETQRLRQRAPSMTAEVFAGGFAPAASALRERRLDVARQVGLPMQAGATR